MAGMPPDGMRRPVLPRHDRSNLPMADQAAVVQLTLLRLRPSRENAALVLMRSSPPEFYSVCADEASSRFLLFVASAGSRDRFSGGCPIGRVAARRYGCGPCGPHRAPGSG